VPVDSLEHPGRLKVAKDFSGAKPLRKKLQYWLQGRIQKYTKYKGHAEGTRFSRALARGPSEHAYVGSGKVHRIGNRQMAVFSKGQKIYNADLSASYNLGARCWMREITDHSKSLGSKRSGRAGRQKFPLHGKTSADIGFAH
jgi:hypothetical protein